MRKVLGAITGENNGKKIKGTVVLMKKNVALDIKHVTGSILDRVHELAGQGVSLQLISAVKGDPAGNGLRGKLGKPAYLENWITKITPLVAGDSEFDVTFDWDIEELGVPGAFIIKNCHFSEFYLKTLTLKNVPGHGDQLHFVSNSWVYPASKYKTDRIFFTNQTYLPSETPKLLRPYREGELVNLRGDGTSRKLKTRDRIYDYDCYNDLGDDRPVLGGSTKYPYPRRGRTGRPPTKICLFLNQQVEALIDFVTLRIYVPRDEQFGHLKMSAFIAYAAKSQIHSSLPTIPTLKGLLNSAIHKFNTYEDVHKLYEGGIKLPKELDNILKKIPFETPKEMVRTNGEAIFKFPMPQVIKENKFAWSTDEEFAREFLAGVNPVVISRLQEFPPASKLDPKVYGNQTSSITREHIGNNLEGLSIDEAIKNNRLFILDYHDALMPYMRRINTTEDTRTYATRTLLFLKEDGTLKPLAIELSLPHPEGDQFGAKSEVYTPAESGVEASIWKLAKAYVAINDYGYHQLISHWLNTHAVVEPFVIATHRQLSVIHPIFKLLHPHFRDTMCINAFARKILVNAGGIMENILFPEKYSMELSSMIYKNWVFPDQALPADLIKRGVAVEDSSSPHGIRLLIEDYPFAVDGLEIWSAIKAWVREYCEFYYKTDEIVQKDTELQSWWKELREKGHGDMKDEPWWPKMQTCKELIETCTTLIWVASALHAAVNFGQYPYAGFLPNRPTTSHRLMPKPGTPEYHDLESNLEKAFFKTVTVKKKAVVALFLVEILSNHSSDEAYLGQREKNWTKDEEPVRAFERFRKKLGEIEERIIEMNKDDQKWRNRVGPVMMPYTLLCPTSEGGLTGRGIPNSISI